MCAAVHPSVPPLTLPFAGACSGRTPGGQSQGLQLWDWAIAIRLARCLEGACHCMTFLAEADSREALQPFWGTTGNIGFLSLCIPSLSIHPCLLHYNFVSSVFLILSSDPIISTDWVFDSARESFERMCAECVDCDVRVMLPFSYVVVQRVGFARNAPTV